MAHPARRRATYEDVLRAPEHMVAEVIDGELHLTPRPALPHVEAAGVLFVEIKNRFGRGRGGPGGWVILEEVELHLGREPAILVPDLAGWRRERLPGVPREPYLTLSPDWVCEVVSPATGRLDRIEKLPVYAANEVRHAWLIDPLQRSLEVYRNDGGRWSLLSTHKDQDKVSAEPFEAAELDLGSSWADVQAEPR
ncbi:MAG TPA: Uma2 family endonuclease [Myxococcales bacterium]